MKTLIVLHNDKELNSITLSNPSIIVGRSPTCDLVIKGKDVLPVHFLAEYVGEGAFEDQNGLWTLIDISGASRNSLGETSGEGIVLSETIQHYKNFSFLIKEDRLQATDIKRGAVKRSLGARDYNSDANSVLELVYYRKDIDLVSNVKHLSLGNQQLNIKPLMQLPFEVNLKTANQVQLQFTKKTDEKYQIFNRGERIDLDFIENSNGLVVTKKDFVKLETDQFDLFMRLVPEITVKFEKFAWTKDFFLRSVAVVLLISFGLTFLVREMPTPDEEKEPMPRIARVEVREPQKPKAETASLQANPAESVKIEVKETTDTKKEPELQKPLLVADPSKVQVKADPGPKPNIGLNNQAPIKEVNTIGLMKKLKNQAAADKKVSADMVINQGIVNEKASENKAGKIVFNQSPVGQLGDGKTSGGNGADAGLASASTTLSQTDVIDAKAKGSVVIQGAQAKFSLGSKGAKANTSSRGLGEKDVSIGTIGDQDLSSPAFGQADGTSLDVAGPLTKEQIRKTLQEVRHSIRNCYETALLTKSTLNGRMTLKWVISPEGNVTNVSLIKSDLKSPQLESCVETIVKDITFPAAPNKKLTTVIYPFVFQGKNK